MKLRAAFVLPLLFLAWSAVPAEAWFPHGAGGSPPAGPCVHSGAGYADGCAGANQSALFINTNFFGASGTTGAAQQSGQAAISYRPPWDVAGVDYPIGPTSLDASLIDAKVSPPTGCTYDADVTISCPGTGNTVDISGRKFIGVQLWMTGTGQTLTGSNWHFQENATDCRRHSGSGMLRGSSAVINLSNGLADFDGSYVPYASQGPANATCANNAEQYGTAGDPGFSDQSTGSATLSGYSLTYTGTPTGTVAAGQYIKVGGTVPFKARILSGSGLNWTLENTTNGGFGNISISGTTMTYTTKSGTPVVGDNIIGTGVTAGTLLVADLGSNQWQVSISQTVTGPVNVTAWKQWNQATPVTVTTGPIEYTGSAFVANSSGPQTYKYVATPSFGTSYGTGTGQYAEMQFNYTTMNSRGSHPNTSDGNHNQFMAWIPQPGSTATGISSIQSFNTIMVEPWSADGGYTGILSQFSTCDSCSPVANSTSGYLIEFANVNMDHNTIISNAAKNNSGQTNVTGGLFRSLSQAAANHAVGNVTWSMTAGGNVTIGSVNSGSGPSVGDTIQCSTNPSCSSAVKILTQIDATHFTASNLTDVKNNNTNSVYRYPGVFDTFTTIGNYVDPTSASLYVLDNVLISVGSRTSTSNINMLTGASAN